MLALGAGGRTAEFNFNGSNETQGMMHSVNLNNFFSITFRNLRFRLFESTLRRSHAGLFLSQKNFREDAKKNKKQSENRGFIKNIPLLFNDCLTAKKNLPLALLSHFVSFGSYVRTQSNHPLATHEPGLSQRKIFARTYLDI